VFLNPFCPLTTAKVLALKAMVILLLTLLIKARVQIVAGCSSEAVGAWARENLVPGCAVLSDGLACFRSVTTGGFSHEAIVTGGKHLNDLPPFGWINTLLGNLKTSLSGTFHALNVDKDASDTSVSTASASTGASRWQ